MKDEYKRIKKLAKKIIGKEKFKKIKKVDSYLDKTQSLKYLFNSIIKERLMDLESKIERLESKVENKDLLIAESKLNRLIAKVAIFNSTFNEEDYNKIVVLVNEIKEEIKSLDGIRVVQEKE